MKTDKGNKVIVHEIITSPSDYDRILEGKNREIAELRSENEGLKEALLGVAEKSAKEVQRLKAELEEYEKRENDPYWYWPQCDVEGCEGVSGYNGMGWRETGYWCLCRKHADEFRKGMPQPKMKDSAIEKEKSRLPDGTLPSTKSLTP